jgi:hypothetical protein
MAETGAIAGGDWFIGDDITLRFTVYTSHARTTCLDVSLFAMAYALRRRNTDADTALISKSTANGTITVTGVFNSDPLVNTQRVLVSIVDTDTDGMSPGSYMHSLKRTDPGFETVMMYSTTSTPAVLTKATL